METRIKRKLRSRIARVKAREVNSVLAYAASFMLTGVPPIVCESVINEFYSSVKKSISTIMH
jgi:hypothetical protein